MESTASGSLFVKKLSLLLPGILSVIGLASIVENVVTWYGFLGDMVSLYVFSRNQFFNWVFDWWAWFKIPIWVMDSFIVYSSLCLAALPFFRGVRQTVLIMKSKRSFAYTSVGVWKLINIILGPVILIIVCVKVKVMVCFGCDYTQRSFTRVGYLYLKYIVTLVFVFMLFLFLNWQVQKILGE